MRGKVDNTNTLPCCRSFFHIQVLPLLLMSLDRFAIHEQTHNECCKRGKMITIDHNLAVNDGNINLCKSFSDRLYTMKSGWSEPFVMHPLCVSLYLVCFLILSRINCLSCNQDQDKQTQKNIESTRSQSLVSFIFFWLSLLRI